MEVAAGLDLAAAAHLHVEDPGWQFNRIFLARKWTQYRSENLPEVPFEKDACMNFLFWTFWAAFQAIFTTVVPFLIQ